MKKHLFALFIMAVVFISLYPNAIYAADESTSVNVRIDELDITFNNDSGYPYIDSNNRTMVPLRITMEKARCTVDYKKETNTAIVIKDDINIEVPIGTNQIIVNGVVKENDTESVIINGRTYLPIRAVLEAAGFLVAWDSSTSTVLINRAFSQYPTVPHFRSVNGSSVIDELDIKNGTLYYCATWGDDVKEKYIATLEKHGFIQTGNEIYNDDLTVSTELQNLTTNQRIYVCVEPDYDGSQFAYITFGENKDDTYYSFDRNSMKIVNESGTEDVSTHVKELTGKFYSNYEDVPDYLNVCNGKIEFETENIKVYSSTDFDKYIQNLDSNYKLIKEETYKLKDSQPLTQYIDVYFYKANQTDVMLFEMEDNGLDETFVFLYLNEEFYYPQYSEIIAELIDSRDENIEDVDITYKSDKNNYLYGYNPNIYSSRIYERKANVSSVKDFERFLKQKYAYLYSPMEDFELDIEIWDNSSSLDGLSFAVHVDFSYVSSDYDVITPYNFDEKYGYTDLQKEETVKQLKEMMKDICTDAEDCFPNAEVSGCVYVSGYHYRHIKVDYYDDTTLSWTNASGQFEWQPSLDTFEIY